MCEVAVFATYIIHCTSKDCKKPFPLTKLFFSTKAVVPDNGRHESGEDLWEKAKVLFRMRKFSESKVAYESYLKSYPNNLEALGQYVSIFIVVENHQSSSKHKWCLT